MQDEAILRDELKIMLDGTLYELIECPLTTFLRTFAVILIGRLYYIR